MFSVPDPDLAINFKRTAPSKKPESKVNFDLITIPKAVLICSKTFSLFWVVVTSGFLVYFDMLPN